MPESGSGHSACLCSNWRIRNVLSRFYYRRLWLSETKQIVLGASLGSIIMMKASRIMLFIEKVGFFDVSLKTFGRCEEQVSLIFQLQAKTELGASKTHNSALERGISSEGAYLSASWLLRLKTCNKSHNTLTDEEKIRQINIQDIKHLVKKTIQEYVLVKKSDSFQ